MSHANPSRAALRGRWRRLRWLGLLPVLLLTACSSVSYYGQAVAGHLALMRQARPIEAWLQAPGTAPALRTQLQLAQRLRAFSVHALDLPDNSSYRRYADIGHPAVIWNVVAAPPDSLQLRRWCFVVAGCVGYRGYFRREAADALAARLQADDGLEVLVYGVPMYSTLGWFNWLGGDPLLSTVIQRQEGELARIIFHELAHQRVYVSGDTRFNESYASAVARLGVEQWLAGHADAATRSRHQAFDRHRGAFRQLTRRTRAELQQLYEAPLQADWLMRKNAILDDFRTRYAALKERWAAAGTPYDGFDRWVQQANNAAFALQAAYDGWVPAFETLFDCVGAHWPQFHAAVQGLADLPVAQRHARLEQYAGGTCP